MYECLCENAFSMLYSVLLRMHGVYIVHGFVWLTLMPGLEGSVSLFLLSRAELYL